MVRLLIKAIIFDYYGVMCPRIAPILARETAKQFGVKYTSVYQVMDRLLDLMDDNSINFYEYWRRLKFKFKSKEVRLSDHQKKWEECTLKLELWPEMKNLVLRLRKLGYTVPVLSNVARKMAEYNMLKGRYKIFKPIFLSYEIGSKKPSTSIFRHALKRMGLKPSECIFIDDNEQYLSGAKSVGIKTILFKNTVQLKTELKRCGIHGI